MRVQFAHGVIAIGNRLNRDAAAIVTLGAFERCGAGRKDGAPAMATPPAPGFILGMRFWDGEWEYFSHHV
jgi:hypothetical protein